MIVPVVLYTKTVNTTLKEIPAQYRGTALGALGEHYNKIGVAYLVVLMRQSFILNEYVSCHEMSRQVLKYRFVRNELVP